jgi:sugar (pentulose or hexulose) kinase
LPRRFVMGLDLGGGSVRCLLLDLAGAAPIVVSRGWPELVGGASDLDLEAIFARLAEASRAALAQAGSDAEVAGLAVSAVRFGSVVIDRDGGSRRLERDSRAALRRSRWRPRRAPSCSNAPGTGPSPSLPRRSCARSQGGR